MSRKKSINVSDPRAHRSRDALLNAAIELLLENPRASMSDIAAHAGVGRATLYRHFESRDELVLELAAESMKASEAVLKSLNVPERPAVEVITEGIRAIMPVADRFHFLMLLWVIASENDEAIKIYYRQLDELAQIVERAKIEKSINESLSTDWIVMLIDSVTYVGWWSIHSGQMNPKQAGDHAVQSLFGGISP
ncbi:MAG: TetR/AcrR family transcriptional regulator [Pseudomonadota bacterium]